jgi:pimeloyl-ACP methyl ester carboxylesterase
MLAMATENIESDGSQHRVFALDFWGFGDSTGRLTDNGSPYTLANYVEMVLEFMDHMGIREAPVVGHSMGGTVALQLALHYPERANKLVIVGSPIIGSSLNPFLKLAGYSWIAKLVWNVPLIRSAIMHLLLAGDSKAVRQMIFRDVERTSLDSFFRSIGDLRDTDLRPDLKELSVPTLGIYGKNDNIVSPSNARLLNNGSNEAASTIFERSRHFPMADQPSDFMKSLLEFFSSDSIHQYSNVLV